MTNEELAVLIQAGDNGFLPQLWEQVRRLIAVKAFRFHSKLGGSRGVEVDDLVQCGYFAVLDAVKYYTPAKAHKFTSYLNMTLKNAFRAAVGLRSSRIDLLFACLSLDAPIAAVDGELSLLDAIPDTGAGEPYADVEESEYTRQLRAALDDALSILGDTDRRQMEQYYYFGMSFQQIADMEGISRTAVEGRHRKSLNRIRRSSHRRKLVPFMYWYMEWDCLYSTGFHTWERLVY